MSVERSDKELWERLKVGDEMVFKYIYQRHIQSLFRYGRQFSMDEELIKDCIQDLFLRLYHHNHSLGQVENIKIYLFISLKNALLNQEKRKISYAQHVDNLYKTSETSVEENRLERAEEELASSQRFDKLTALLTTRQREIVHCRFVEGMSIPDIGILMDMNTQSVSNVLYRSLSRLKKELK